MRIYFRDTQNFLKHLSLAKLFNAAKLVSSFYLTKILKKPVQWGLPMTISVEPTTACNLRCPECPSGLRAFSRATGNLKQDFFKNTIDQIYSKMIYLILTYEQYRKEGKLETVLQGAKNLVAAREELQSKTPHIIFQFLVVKPNEHQIPEIYKLADEIGIDEVKLKTAQIYDYKEGHPLIPSEARYSRYKKDATGKYQIKNKLLNHCWKLWHACVITWDGLVVPCCFDKDALHRLGDLKKNDFPSIWQGKKYSEFRGDILRGRDKIDICQNCTEGCQVWA